MKVLIAGCGYLGTALGLRLLREQNEVWGLRRDQKALRTLDSQGIKPVSADLLRPESLRALPRVDFAVLCQAPARGLDPYRETYYQGTCNLLRALADRRPKKLILVSSTRVYGINDGAWVDENTDPSQNGYPDEEERSRAGCLLDAERAALTGGIPSVVFRLGGIYGPGRNRLKPIREGKIKPYASGEYSNRIHAEDAALGILLLMEKGSPGEITLGVDDEPSRNEEFYRWVCGRIRAKLPDPLPALDTVSGKRCSNRKIKSLGMKFQYPTFREGYAALIAAGETQL